MSAAAGKPIKHIDMGKQLGEFYLALGAFNKAAVERILMANGDKEIFGQVIGTITNAACEVHDRQCDDGYYFDHDLDACVRIRNVIPD